MASVDGVADLIEEIRQATLRNYTLPLLARSPDSAYVLNRLFKIVQPVHLLNPSDILGADPNYKAADSIDVPVTWTKKTTPVLISLNAFLSSDGVNRRFMSFETPSGTDYSVPASKIFEALFFQGMSDAANAYWCLGYGTTGVADGIAAPAGVVRLIGANVTAASPLVTPTANTTIDKKIYMRVPAAGFPHVESPALASSRNCQLYGIEVDA